MTEALKPCPFACKASPVMLTIREEGVDAYDRETLIRCDECGAEVAEEYASDAIARWNRRIGDPAEEGDETLPEIAKDGPHRPNPMRMWLARQLMDSRLTDEEAYDIVAHSQSLDAALGRP